jgi:hypothetical protein
MSTFVVDRPAVERAAGRAPRSAVWALARSEGGRLTRHPIFLGGVLLSAVAFVMATKNRAPVLHRDDILAGAALLPLAGATMLVSNLAALRSLRHGTGELFDSTITTRQRRTMGHLLSVGWAAGGAALMVLLFMLYLVSLDPVGVPSAFEVLTGPAVVALLGALGVFVATWWRSVAAGPVVLVGVGALQLALSLLVAHNVEGTSGLRWLAPWVSLTNNDGTPPRELVIRPAGWHLMYVLALTVALGSLALVRSGLRLRRGGLVGLATVVAVWSGVMQTLPPSGTQLLELAAMVEHPERYQACEAEASVRYCAYPAYAPWIERWQAVVTPVMAKVPMTAHPAGLLVQQSFLFDASGSDVPGEAIERLSDPGTGRPLSPNGPAIHVGASWLRGQPDTDEEYREQGEADQELALALGISARIVGLPGPHEGVVLTAEDADRLLDGLAPDEREGARTFIFPGAAYPGCEVAGQARGMVALWLAGQATPGTASLLRSLVARDHPRVLRYDDGTGTRSELAHGLDIGGGVYYVFTGGLLSWSWHEAAYAVQMLDRPAGQTAALLEAHWDALIDPATRADEAIAMLGLHPLPTLEEMLENGGRSRGEARQLIASSFARTVPCR